MALHATKTVKDELHVLDTATAALNVAEWACKHGGQILRLKTSPVIGEADC